MVVFLHWWGSRMEIRICHFPHYSQRAVRAATPRWCLNLLLVLAHPPSSAWWISSLSDPLSLLFSLPHACSFSIIYGLFLCCYTGFCWGLGWGGGGDGRWSVCTFSGKLKYSCMCACVAVWERLHVYPSLLFVYVRASARDCGLKNTAARKDGRTSIWGHVWRFLPGDAWSPVVWFSSQIKTPRINYPWPALHALTQPTEEEELAEHASLIHHYVKCLCTYLKNIHFFIKKKKKVKNCRWTCGCTVENAATGQEWILWPEMNAILEV